MLNKTLSRPKRLGARKPVGRRHLALRQSAARRRPASPLITSPVRLPVAAGWRAQAGCVVFHHQVS